MSIKTKEYLNTDMKIGVFSLLLPSNIGTKSGHSRLQTRWHLGSV